ncbi:sulfatase, partial [Acidobacteria bacterium AH-259-O06]|nr:sulfatase [Acidobacteria bacterium AH-259-O06]
MKDSGRHLSLSCLIFLVLGGLTLLFSCASPTAPDGGRPNFVFILIDDLGWKDLGCYGSTFYETPNIDQLANEGMRFTDAYTAAPVCSPTRASLLTGKYPASLNLTDWIRGRKQWPWAKLLVPEFNQQLPLQEVTIAEALKAAGYVTASIGKWHLGQEPYYPTEQGFDLNFGGTHRGSPPTYFCPYEIPTIEECSEGEYLTDRLTEEAETFIEKNQDKPFLLYLSHFAVHIPLEAKQELIAKYEAKANAEQPQNNAVYAAMIESMDESVGRMMKKLQELQIADRTVIFFTSDNGGLVYEGKRTEAVTSNEPLRAGKGHLYEGGVRVPLIVRWLGLIEPGSVSPVPVTSTDFYPTILEMADMHVDPQQTIDGVSFLSLLKQTGELKRDAIYWHYPHYSNQGGEPGGVVRQGDYKLIEFYRDGKLELYNLREDIGEKSNLAEQRPDKAAELHQMLKEWRRSVNAQMPAV